MSWWNKKKEEELSLDADEELIPTPAEEETEDYKDELISQYSRMIANYSELIEKQHLDIVRGNNALALANEAVAALDRTAKTYERIESKIMIYKLQTIGSCKSAEDVKEKLLEFIRELEGKRPSDAVLH